MQHLVFHFDVASPEAYLAFEQLPELLQGISHEVRYRPVLLDELLLARGRQGPAEFASQQAWTRRQVDVLAQQAGLPLHWPTPQPFNPQPLLRLALACDEPGREPNRRVVEALLRHVWRGAGADPNDPQRLAALTAELQPLRDPQSDDLMAELRALTDAAVARSLLGVPSIETQGRLYSGLGAWPRLRSELQAAAAGQPS